MPELILRNPDVVAGRALLDALDGFSADVRRLTSMDTASSLRGIRFERAFHHLRFVPSATLENAFEGDLAVSLGGFAGGRFVISVAIWGTLGRNGIPEEFFLARLIRVEFHFLPPTEETDDFLELSWRLLGGLGFRQN